jgi:hypothetical protein
MEQVLAASTCQREWMCPHSPAIVALQEIMQQQCGVGLSSFGGFKPLVQECTVHLLLRIAQFNRAIKSATLVLAAR